MKKSNKGLIIACSILGVFLLGFAFVAIGMAFEIDFVCDIEWAIVSDWGWTKFNLLAWSLVLVGVFTLTIIAILVISDNKVNKDNSKARRQNKYFGQ